jgi:hypothetical protein
MSRRWPLFTAHACRSSQEEQPRGGLTTCSARLTLSTLPLTLALMADDDTLMVIASPFAPEEAGMLREILESAGIAAAVLNNVSLSEQRGRVSACRRWPCAHPRLSARVR